MNGRPARECGQNPAYRPSGTFVGKRFVYAETTFVSDKYYSAAATVVVRLLGTKPKQKLRGLSAFLRHTIPDKCV